MRAKKIENGIQECSKCKTALPLSFFYKSNHHKSGFDGKCKACRKIYYLEWTREKGGLQKKLIQSRNWYKKNPEKYIYTNAKNNAKQRSIEFSLTIEDIVIPDICPLLGIKIERTFGEGRHDALPSIDRLNPKLGYVKDNVKIISFLANRMKNNATAEQIKKLASNIDDYLSC